MLFNSIEFLVFFPLVCVLFFLLPHPRRWLLLLIASYWFYMSWKPEYLLLLAGSTAVDYFCGIRMAALPEVRARRPYLYLSLTANLGLLFLFKYLGFFSETLGLLAREIGTGYTVTPMRLVLPVGISFYTFQSLSYTIEVYRGRVKAERHPGMFAGFVSFFPQLIAGPITRAGTLLPQFKQVHYLDAGRISSGLRLMAWGMFKKVMIADRLAVGVNHVYDNPTSFSGPVLALATVLFAYQIYCDFSGYTDIAIGAARVLGFQLMENFRTPYYSKSIGEFWQRWHISLSTWFRDYVYIPLGGNRTAKWRWYCNLWLTFLLSGIWHGAAWTFVAWGALHGTYLVLGIVTKPLRDRVTSWSGIGRWPLLLHTLQMAVTFVLVCFGWIFFRAQGIGDALYIVSRVFTGYGDLVVPGGLSATVSALGMGSTEFKIAVLSIMALEAVHIIQIRIGMSVFLAGIPAWFRWVLYYGVLASMIYYGAYHRSSEFIYFQF